MQASTPLPLCAHEARLLALPIALLHRLALVVFALALGDAELDLGDAPLVEIERKRDQGDALALHLADQAIALALVQQQFARTPGLVIELARRLVFRDVGVEQPDLAALL